MPSWKKVIISGSDAALNSLNVTNNVVATSLTGSFSIPNTGTLTVGSQVFYPQGNDGFSVNEDFNVGSSTQTAYHFTSGNSARPSVVFSLARTANFTNMFGVTGSAADNKFVFGAEFANTDFEWRKSLGVTPVQLQGGTLLARLTRSGSLFVSSDITGSNAQFTGDLTVDTNTLYVDSANNRVGIGTTSPSQKLTVEGDITGSGYVKGSTLYALDDVVVGDQILHYGDTDTNLSFTTDKIQINAGGVQMITLTEGAADNVHINAGAVDVDFKVSTNNDNDALFVEGSTDRVGIGTGTPSQKLDVNGNASISGSLTVSQGGNFTMDGGGTLDTGGGSINTTGGSIDTNGGNITLGIGALNGTIPGSAVNVDTVTATVKNFVIDHPSEEKAGYKLRHSSLEGPEIGVYFRGKSTGSILDLPDYWKDLVNENSITVSLTSFGSPCQHYIEDIRDNQVIVGCACGTPNYHFTVYGERKDVEKLVVEYKEEKYL